MGNNKVPRNIPLTASSTVVLGMSVPQVCHYRLALELITGVKKFGGMRKTTTCLVCDSDNAKYKFRCCLRAFCSQDCFQKHRDCDSLVALKSSLPERRFLRKDNVDLNLPDEEILSEELLERVASNKDVSDLLRDPLLHRILIRLDNARDRRQVFSKLYDTSPVFFQLVELLSGIVSESSVDLAQVSS